MDAASSHSFGISEIPGSPSFRNSAVNAIAVIPLLSSKRDGDDASTKSTKSFGDLFDALRRYTQSFGHSASSEGEDFYLIVPNSSLTRPGDWKYDETPLKGFHWQHGCQRMRLFDGRPEYSRLAHDRLMNHTIAREWIDLCPSRRTAAVIGVLNVHDCHDISDLHRAEEELRKWAEKYASPPYEVSAHGKDAERDHPVYRMFVYDSFDEEGQKIDLSHSKMGSQILAFPPTDDSHAQMMDLHLNVVINDLAVAIFRDLESKIRESDQIRNASNPPAPSQNSVLSRIISAGNSDRDKFSDQSKDGKLNVGRLAGLVSAGNPLADTEADEASTATKGGNTEATSSVSVDGSSFKASSSLPLLLTPLDTYWEQANLTRKDMEDIRKRDIGRREKYSADLALLAGSPLDAYERYLKAAELCKSSSASDPLWYAASLEGCAGAHISMAEAGGYNVDEYLENNFQLPKDFFNLMKIPEGEKYSNVKQSLPDVVIALCEEALAIVSRNALLSAYRAEILLKLAWYLSDLAERHQRCRWGEGDGCYAGESGSIPRWERPSVFALEFDPEKLRENGAFNAQKHTLKRIAKICEFLGTASSLSSLHSGTRVDVAAQAVSICLHGIKPTSFGVVESAPAILHRKAAFYAAIAADAAGTDSSSSALQLWLLTTQLYSKNPGPSYGWATLRSACLSTLASRGNSPLCLEAAEELLSLLCTLEPSRKTNHVPDNNDDQEHASIEVPVMDISNHCSTHEESNEHDEQTDFEETNGVDATSKITSTKVFAKQLRDTITTFASSSSSFIAQQSKWASDEPLANLLVPLGESSSLSFLATDLHCVWPSSDLSKCSSVQNQCLNCISLLRRALTTPSQGCSNFPLIYANEVKPPGPLFVISASAARVVSQIEGVKSALHVAAGDVANPAMSTFYNPFETKRNAGGRERAKIILEGEERVISVKFGNKLAVPVEATNAQLIFGESEALLPVSTPLAFAVPPNTSDFIVYFPLTVISKRPKDSADAMGTIDIKGIECECLGQVEFIQLSIDAEDRGCSQLSNNILPIPTSVYPFAPKSKKITGDDPESVKALIQAFPSQPTLELRLAESNLPVSRLSATIINGALYTSVPLRLFSSSGAFTRGNVEGLEIFVSGSGGINQKIFDSSASPSENESDDDFLKEWLVTKTAAPLKVRAKAATLSMKGINGQNAKNDDSNTIRFQIASGYDATKKLPSLSTLNFKFRYSGSSRGGFQVWRTTRFVMEITTSTGPCISSISFLHESKISNLMKEYYAGEPNLSTQRNEGQEYSVGDSVSANICNKEIGILVTVLNASDYTVELTKEDGHLGEAACVPMKKLLVRPLVNVKIPMTLSRISVSRKDDIFKNIVDKIQSSAVVIWKSEGSSLEENKGQIRIPRSCLEELVRKETSLVPKLIEPPLTFKIFLDNSSSAETTKTIGLGSPGAKVSTVIKVADWVTEEEKNSNDVIIELVCVQENGTSISRDHFHWAGKVGNRVKLSSESFEHSARITFHRPGVYIVTACAKFVKIDKSQNRGREMWYAPFSRRIVVSDTMAQ
ncbi:hypothetical protein FisN_14Lh236 [Fistulifera solaris]|uniref:Trs120/TRAPPC9 N-terminal domain-containing protein n=1 Tax=Fistulifera solaris TaxID=1519565 RepID=A0A1Z5J9Q2_FISSO|nr:hypothetical protein FisN_14Lh236 [Fistulifera solaris]|eukprot:GAX10720.1 hypothetical protein FisN_14Lh236 [Fistulifera solaris]